MTDAPQDPAKPNDKLEDLSAEILSRGLMLTPEATASLRVAMARVETKLDGALAVQSDFNEFEKWTVTALHLQDVRLTKLEAWQGTLMWVAGGAITLGGAAMGFALTKIFG